MHLWAMDSCISVLVTLTEILIPDVHVTSLNAVKIEDMNAIMDIVYHDWYAQSWLHHTDY